jgi:hypothetical protein
MLGSQREMMDNKIWSYVVQMGETFFIACFKRTRILKDIQMRGWEKSKNKTLFSHYLLTLIAKWVS